MARLASLVVCTLVIVGCAAAPPDGADPSASAPCAADKCDVVEETSAPSLDRLPERAASVLCRHAQVCNATDARLSILTEEECRAEWTETWRHRIDLLRPSLSAGRVVYEGERAGARLDEIARHVAAGECLVDSTLDARHFFRGTVATGEACRHDECVEGASCIPGSAFECAGVCTAVPPPTPTGACANDDECLPTEGCVEGTCRALSPASEDAACHRSAQCPPGLFCQPAADGSRRCGAPRSDGSPCDATTVCGRGRTCRIQDDGSHACGLAPGEGDVCDGTLVFCRVLGLVCDFTDEGVSRCRRMGREGDACTGGDCDLGLRCDHGADGTTYPGACRPARAAGEPCQSAEDCLGDWCGPGNVCVNQFGSLGCAM